MKALWAVAFVCFLALASCSNAETSRAEELVKLLEDSDYEVQLGEVFPFRIADCVELPSCFGNNATSPYALWRLPPAPGEPTLQVNADSLQPDALGRTAQWALRQDEAVVYIGKTGPSAAYMSYAPYIFSRANSANEQITVFASLADSINQTAFDGDAFDREIAVIVSANEALQSLVRQALANGGMNDADIKWVALSAEQLRFGLDEQADRILMLATLCALSRPRCGRSLPRGHARRRDAGYAQHAAKSTDVSRRHENTSRGRPKRRLSTDFARCVGASRSRNVR